MLLPALFDHSNDYWSALVVNTLADEASTVQALLRAIDLSDLDHTAIQQHARKLVETVRATSKNSASIENFLCQYQLSSNEGIALMCLAEALLRIPNAATRDQLIQDKLTNANWHDHLGQSDSTFVNAATWGLLLTAKILKDSSAHQNRLARELRSLVQRSGSWMVRQTVNRLVGFLSEQFVLADTITNALKRAAKQKDYHYSFDMLGEAVLTASDAERYTKAYEEAILAVAATTTEDHWRQRPGLSIKLSALHPRYEMAQRVRVLDELVPRLRALVVLAQQHNIGITIDAEEAGRLTLSLEVFQRVFDDSALQQWDGFGLAVQTYQKRAPYVIAWLQQLAEQGGRQIPVRLIKGAYWDSEIKWAQQQGLTGYPVFTRKVYTDVNYIQCVQRLLAAPHAFYCQFATHNAHTVATILHLTQQCTPIPSFEFQCLHGMGQQLYEQIVTGDDPIPCRVYAPVGAYQELLPYLVRRLLENGANTSFVHRIVDQHLAIDDIVADPCLAAANFFGESHLRIPEPSQLYQGDESTVKRINSSGLNLTDEQTLNKIHQDLESWREHQWKAYPTVKVDEDVSAQVVQSPIDGHCVGQVMVANEQVCESALITALTAQVLWDQRSVDERAVCLEQAAEHLAAHQIELMALLQREAGKTLQDALDEVREAIDFCRYYAATARQQLIPQLLTGPTGEKNQLTLHGRGVMLCISPWNLPLAIFMGQVSAALVTGNAVIAKPAEQTPLIAARVVALLYEAGIPREVLALLPGQGETVGQTLVNDSRIAGVLFTGSTTTARLIAKTLATRKGPLVPLVAETGGQNAMIVDASALVEQVVQDVIDSAFGSAGQRCSALRVLFVQEDVADHLLDLLMGAMAELQVGDPRVLSTDVGPVIDREALTRLQAHCERMHTQAKCLAQVPLLPECTKGTYIAPTLFEIQHLNALPEEVFGPILHVIRYQADKLDDVIEQINETGYGLTLGIHSRIEQTISHIIDRVHIGNVYVNRNMVGAVVGVQPFGGQGLSGTGPKAGGPRTLTRLCHERTVSVNTTAAGGNASLLSLEDE